MLLAMAFVALTQVSSGVPPSVLSGSGNMDRIEKVYSMNYVSGVASCLMYERQIQVAYLLSQVGPREVPLDERYLTEEVPFWPTSVAVLGDQLLAVAGKRQTRTVIEIWQLRAPPPILAPVGGAATGFGGEPTDAPAVRRKTTIYDESIAGRDMVRSMVSNRGKSDSLFVQFHDSGDLYEIDYGEAVAPSSPAPAEQYPISLVLSAQAGGGAPVASELGNVEYRWIQSRLHHIEGLCYVVIKPFDVQMKSPDLPDLAFWLFDHDLDGELDEWGVLSASDEISRGLDSNALYVDQGQATIWSQ